MSSACGIRQVESQAHAYYVTQFTYKSEKSTDLNYSINPVSYAHSPRTTDESLHYFVLPSENQNAFARSADFEFHIVPRGPRLYSRIETAWHLVRSDFFAKIYTNFEIRRRVPRVKKSDEIQKEHTHLSLALSLSLSTCRSADGMFTLMSLSLHLQTRFRSRSDLNGIQNRMFRQFKNVCIR